VLLNNYINNTGLGREYGRTNPYMYFKDSTCRQFYVGDHVVSGQTDKSGFPTATEPPYSFLVAPKGSLFSSTTLINGEGAVEGRLAQGINIAANLSGVGDLTASMSVIIQLASTLSGSGALTADMVGVIQMAANLAGAGDLQGSLSLITNMSVALSGSGTISGALLTGIANMEAEITPFTALSPESLSAAIMNYMVEGNYTFEQCIRLLTAVAAGKTTIVDLGGGLATVTFRDINDTQDRVIADMTDSERTTVALDLDDVI